MKAFTLLPLLALLLITSCSPVRVAIDYDRRANFGQYGTFAFYRPGIDEAQISDLDKKRILRAIESELQKKGLNKSESPDLLVSIFTKERERVEVWNNNFGWGWGWGWGWNPWWGGGNWGTTVTTTPEGTLYIDLIDAKSNELVWQGIGSARLILDDIDKKERRIQEIVSEIMAEFPPGQLQQ
jgi:hypothetical protein